MNMRRRDFIIGAAVIAVLPRVACAQPRDRARRIGMLLLFSEGDPEALVRVKVFGQALQELGWTGNNDVKIEHRFAAGSFDKMRAFAKELVELKPDVIVTNSIQSIIAVWRQTRTIPIVFAMSPDPVDAGLIKSLSHPDETITGFMTFEYAIVGKWLELLKGIAPCVSRVGLMFNPDAYEKAFSPPRGNWMDWLRQLEAFAPSFAVDHVALPVRNFAETEDALAEFAHRPGGGLLVATDPFTVGNYQRL